MKIYKGRQYIVTFNPEYIRQLYEHQEDGQKMKEQIMQEILRETDDFLKGNHKRIISFIMHDGSPSITITPLIRHTLQERRKAKRRKR